jgi:Mannosyl-glycoprotein endo-beta-N-acetylglucosaminidase.
VPGTTTVPTTVALLPPPPPFPLGDDFGRLLLIRWSDAFAASAAATADIATSTQLVELTTEHRKVAERGQAQARAHAVEVKRQLIAIHEQVKALAVDAYILGSSAQITGALSSFASAHDVVEMARNLTFVHSSHDRLLQLVELERREQARAVKQVRVATKALDDAVKQWRGAQARLAEAQQRRANALADIDQAARDQERFFRVATTSASPIMGPSRLTAGDLVAYIDSLHLIPKLTVPLRTLAGYYISEGEAEGVRGDVAFAQSILETGAFMFPGHGLLDPVDNNFAGIDACDSCKHGDRFESALIGVRAQMQLLRIYADPSVKKITDLAHPLALLHEPRLGFSGHVQTWYALGGRWATGPNYGFHVYDIYLQMVALAEK